MWYVSADLPERRRSFQAKDELRNRRLAGGDCFLVWLEGPATVHAVVQDNGDGTYLATHNATVTGMYQLYITNGG